MNKSRRPLVILLIFLFPLLLLALGGWGRFSATSQVAPATLQQAPDPLIKEIIGKVKGEDLGAHIGNLSGERPIKVGGETVTLKTRYTPSREGALSEQYVYEYFRSLGLSTQYHNWTGTGQCDRITGRNVVAEIKGKSEPERIYIIGGHLDSISPNPVNAPGADDNASGTAAVMVAAKILKEYSFKYTLRFVAFTGEERGLCGSIGYAQDARANNNDIRGVINLDMIGYDSDGSKDIELHVGTRLDSQVIADLMVESINTYGLDLTPHLLTNDAVELSDHSSFWRENYPAILGIEYLFTGDDGNPYYHSVICCDTVEHMDFGMVTDFTKAALATLATLGGVQPATPAPTATPVPVITIPGAERQLFSQTGKTVSGLFLGYWQQRGGLAQQGYPISEVMGEVSDLDGKPYTVQYFERAVFEYHPRNEPPYNVLLSQLGTFRYKSKYASDAPSQRPSAQEDSKLFPETGKRVGGLFLKYWEANGGLAQQGLPISEEFVERSEADGKEYLVQYFERAVFEHHPENEPPYDVLLSQLGTFQYKQKHDSP